MKMRIAIVAVLLLLAGLASWALRRPAPPVFTASDGSIYTDKLFYGLLLLEESPSPLSADQARQILVALDRLDVKLKKNEHYDQELLRILREDQNAFLEQAGAGVREEDLKLRMAPDLQAAVVSELAALADTPVPTEEILPPPDIVPSARPLRVSRMALFVLGWPALAHEPALVPDQAQARELLPFVWSYVHLKSDRWQIKRELLGLLREDQRRWIDEHALSAEGEIRDMTVLTREVRALAESRARSAP